MLVTVLGILVTHIHLLFTSKGFTNNDNTTMSPTSLSSLQKYLSSGFSEDDSVQIGELMKWSLELEPVILRYSRWKIVFSGVRSKMIKNPEVPKAPSLLNMRLVILKQDLKPFNFQFLEIISCPVWLKYLDWSLINPIFTDFYRHEIISLVE